jgi:hypothetical protein
MTSELFLLRLLVERIGQICTFFSLSHVRLSEPIILKYYLEEYVFAFVVESSWMMTIDNAQSVVVAEERKQVKCIVGCFLSNRRTDKKKRLKTFKGKFFEHSFFGALFSM